MTDQAQGQINPDEILLDEEIDAVAAADAPANEPVNGRWETRFLALDKCLPRRSFLEVRDQESLLSQLMIDYTQVIDFPTNIASEASNSGSRRVPRLSFDGEWLAITRAFQPYLSRVRGQRRLPDERQAGLMLEKEKEWVKENVLSKSQDGIVDVMEVQKFAATAPGPSSSATMQPREWTRCVVLLRLMFILALGYSNPQTVGLCELLEMEDKVTGVRK